MPPQLSNAILPTDIPDGKVHILVLDGLHVETYTAYESGFLVQYVDVDSPIVGMVVTTSPSLSL